MVTRAYITATMTLLILGAGQNAKGGIVLSADQSGWYDKGGSHNAALSNYFTGQITPTLTEHRSFFVFDLSNVHGVITSAQLDLFNPQFGYSSFKPSETLGVFDVSTAISELIDSHSTRQDIFQDLGSGTQFGSKQVTNSDNGPSILIPLNAPGLAALNAAEGKGSVWRRAHFAQPKRAGIHLWGYRQSNR